MTKKNNFLGKIFRKREKEQVSISKVHISIWQIRRKRAFYESVADLSHLSYLEDLLGGREF